MFLRAAVVLSLMLGNASAQTRTVCEALTDLSDLNGRDVNIRGVFASGDTGQVLFASPPCPQPTTRDGWAWRDVIRVYPADGRKSASATIADYRRMAKAHPGCKILVTLTGRLETRDHFDVQTFPDGFEWPVAFKWFVARLSYRTMGHLEAIRREPGEDEQELEWRRRPYAMRARPDANAPLRRAPL
jgi:hypothetical protein